MMLAHAKAVLAFHNGGFKGKIGVIQSLEFKYPLNENDPADIKAANNEHVLQNQFLLDATFRGDYAPDTLECANRLAAISGGTIEILDDGLEIMREAALYNDYLGVNNYQCRFLKAYDGENDLHHNGTGEKGTGRWRVKGIGEHVNKPGIPTTDWDWIIYPEGLFDLLVYIKQRYPNYKQIFITENGMGYKDPTRTVLWMTSRASTTSSSTCVGCSRPWRWASTWAATSCGACRISSPGPMATTSAMASSTLTLRPRSARPRQAPTGTSTWRRPVVWTSGLRPVELPRSHNLSPFLSRGRHVTQRAAPGLFVFGRFEARLSRSVTSSRDFWSYLLQIEMNEPSTSMPAGPLRWNARPTRPRRACGFWSSGLPDLRRPR